MIDIQTCITKREQLCLTRTIALKVSGMIYQLYIISDNNLSTLVYSGYNVLLVVLLFDLCILYIARPKQETSSVWLYCS